MKNFRFPLFIVGQIGWYYCLYAWLVSGLKLAENAGLFLAWMTAVIGSLMIFLTANRNTKPIPPRNKLLELIGNVSVGAQVLIFASQGMFWLATFTAIGAVGSQMWRDQFHMSGDPKH